MQPIAALDGRDRLAGSPGLLILDGGGELIELGFDEFAQPADRLFLLRIIDDQPAEFVDRRSDRRSATVVWNEVGLGCWSKGTRWSGLPCFAPALRSFSGLRTARVSAPIGFATGWLRSASSGAVDQSFDHAGRAEAPMEGRIAFGASSISAIRNAIHFQE